MLLSQLPLTGFNIGKARIQEREAPPNAVLLQWAEKEALPVMGCSS